jgi:hypothetical protein
MADSLNPIDIEQSLADFDTAYTDAFVTKKENIAHIGALPMSAVHTLRRHTAELGNAVDNVIRELVDKYTAIKHTSSTTDATPTTIGTAGTVPDGGVLMIELHIWGKKAAQDIVYVRQDIWTERNGGSVIAHVHNSVKQYSYLATLSTANATLLINSTDLDVQVTGEGSTTIAWEGYTLKREVTFA